ncbi:MAG: alpha/beta hydrolase-fold protein [Candidatus Bathyarchaeota archaeon]|nr:alpha/beta hydrolase-fold protein [Candidatus Bathyarchaeota archaeon]
MEVNEVNRRIIGVAVTLILIAALSPPFASMVQAKKVAKTDMDGYTEYIGTLDGANFVVRIPDEWNGMLVVGCHKWMPFDWNPDAQLAMDNLVNGEGIGLPFALLEQGFAYAASSYGEGGFAVKMGMIRTHQLAEYVIDNFGVTGKVFIIGHSMGGLIGLLLGEKYPELYGGVLDICGMKNVTQAYLSVVSVINDPIIWPKIPPERQKEFLQMKADIEAEYGGTYYDKPKAYEKRNPVSNAEISIPIISVHGAQDPNMPAAGKHALSYGIAVDAAGCSEYYRVYIANPGKHDDPPVIDAAILHFKELVDYPVGW